MNVTSKDMTDALHELFDARASQGWPSDWYGMPETGGWAFTSPSWL